MAQDGEPPFLCRTRFFHIRCGLEREYRRTYGLRLFWRQTAIVSPYWTSATSSGRFRPSVQRPCAVLKKQDSHCVHDGPEPAVRVRKCTGSGSWGGGFSQKNQAPMDQHACWSDDHQSPGKMVRAMGLPPGCLSATRGRRSPPAARSRPLTGLRQCLWRRGWRRGKSGRVLLPCGQ